MDMDTFLTTLYVYIDDWYKSEMADEMKRQHGPAPKMSDSEVLTVAIAGQWRGTTPWDSERGVVRYMQEHGRGWFPRMLSRSRFNERVRHLWGVIVRLQQELARCLEEATPTYEVVDCLPVPACSNAQSRRGSHWLWWSTRGHGGTQSKWYWGDQAIVSVRSDSVITGWMFGPANTDDRCMMQGLLSHRHHLPFRLPEPWRRWRQLDPPTFIAPHSAAGKTATMPYYLADKGFNGYRWQQHWYQQFQVSVITEPARNAKRVKLARSWRRWFHSLRQVVETTFAILTTVFSIKRLQAHSRWGLYTRFALATAAFNIGIWLNRRMGRPDLSHATLIC